MGRALAKAGADQIITRSHEQLDLTDAGSVSAFFGRERPDIVILCAARVGGILANSTYPAEFIHTNLAIQTNVIHDAWRHGVERLVFLGSSCIYPRDCGQPIREIDLLTGALEPTNQPYAIAKIAGIEMCWSYNRQYGTRYFALMPNNLFGPGDNYDLETSHVLPALIRRFHEAKERGDTAVTLWGTGAPRREFLYVDDLAGAALYLMALPEDGLTTLYEPDAPPLVNVGVGRDISIAELAGLIKDLIGFSGKLAWDESRPDGSPRKLLDVSLLQALGWRATTSLREGIELAYRDFLARYPDSRAMISSGT